MRISQFTNEQILRFYSLDDRAQAVHTVCNAMAYLRSCDDRPPLNYVNSLELLRDALKNAIDDRATGSEWRNIRWTYNNKRDGSHLPVPRDRRCQRCGAVDPEPLTRCPAHHCEPRNEEPKN